MSLLLQFRGSSELGTGNQAYVDGLYESWLADPNSVSAEWQRYFEAQGTRSDRAHGPVIDTYAAQAKLPAVRYLSAPQNNDYADRQGKVQRLANAYRSRGHLRANLDPLGLMPKLPAPDLDLAFHGLNDADLATEFSTSSLLEPGARGKLKDILGKLQATYTQTIGAEFMHIDDTEQRLWIQDKLERAAGQFGFSADKKKRVLDRLTAAEGLERFLHTKYVGQKRFSLEGGDALIPMMDALVQHGGRGGVKEIVIGMAHRGRLNVLVNVLGKSPTVLFAEFEGKAKDEAYDPAHSGDVKYHMGYSADVRSEGGPVHLALAFNPSHLEIVDPVVAGSVRARQTRRLDETGDQVMPVLIHGDSAFAGQGVIMELFNMSQARGFKVGGTVHLVVNNQVGFTTSRPDDTRSTYYCTDVAKMVNCPVFHVNGDDPEACVFVSELAFEYRQRFKRDVVIDLVCYRRHGHNEADEPAATQPLMYQNIRARKTTRELYADALSGAGVLPVDAAKALVDAYRRGLDEGQAMSELTQADPNLPIIDWHRHLDATMAQTVTTGLPVAKLQALSAKINTLPAGASLHPRVAKVYEDRLKMQAGELRMDWGYAETLAYATLVEEGYKLRLVGQDAGRGTFFHRHAVTHDQKTGEARLQLADLGAHPGAVEVIDSVLSEEAVMAFEYGFATTDPNTMVIWEGQFGDFANGAQVVIDQFISSGESKWGRLCGLALFLPHGYEGQGPEHSSARLERFLQLCAVNNMQVVTPTTPAQMFHMLRRQMLRDVRKPLVVMTPKSMLRHRLSTSTLQDLEQGSFQILIPDSFAKDAAAVTRVVVCAGKVYYDLLEDAEKRALTNVAIVRVEQLYPFPRAELKAELARFPNAKEVIWCQEEPMNQGAWYQIGHHLNASISAQHRLHYAGRARSAAPACGKLATHVVEQAALLEQALVAKQNGGHAPE
ncbi:2-oxoglutarate dehydrogenase E1 component [Ahniella affigens]|uniref:oxoglutarate dehydrogenase (succinyl-transferring) n=1 Tax=Ahniella affigens TaxID=2021234 RepID=A0A2P1PM61_9GAMM|nr:2-oxoglutarate dehydrogenase E1 component [Ahniella affigens]AVP95931.1 2-oxoglutarate dehydrogenase E1 component [Ahniella affigens]